MTFNENKAIYLQLAERIMDAIIADRFAPGSRIPSVREYAAEVEVNPNTVVRSYEYLEQKEIVYNKRGLGFFVAESAREKIISMRKAVFYAEELPYFFERIESFGWTPAELAAEYEQFCKNNKLPE
ncbi:MAG: GntR family transcriptional regulator [Paramuribaculum sp.]|nr:GntR family transcriptional regulator [Paramuribaculum sp.]